MQGHSPSHGYRHASPLQEGAENKDAIMEGLDGKTETQ